MSGAIRETRDGESTYQKLRSLPTEELAEFLRLPPQLLSRIERQEQYLGRMWSVGMPCPNCLAEVSLFAGVPRDETGENDFDCPNCGAHIVHTVPLIQQGAPWYWTLAPGQIERKR